MISGELCSKRLIHDSPESANVSQVACPIPAGILLFIVAHNARQIECH